MRCFWLFMQEAGDDCLHGSYALYESPQKKAKTGSKPDEKPLHRLLGQDEVHTEYHSC